MSHLASLAAAVVLIALLFLSLRRRDVDSQGIHLWRALLPSWRFFESPDVSYLLLARVCDGAADAPFVPVIPAAARTPLSALYAPQHNLTLACHGLVEALAQELAERTPIELTQAEQLVSYRRVQRLVCFYMPTVQRYQIKLVAEQPDGSEQEELFVSPIYERG